MYGWDHDEEPADESYRRLPPRRHHPHDDFDDSPDYGRSRPHDDFDGRRDFGTGHPRADSGRGHDYSRSQPPVPSDYDHYFDHPASAARPDMGSRRRPASDHLRSAGRRVGHALGWFGVLVIAPLIVGILAGAVGQHIGL